MMQPGGSDRGKPPRKCHVLLFCFEAEQAYEGLR